MPTEQEKEKQAKQESIQRQIKQIVEARSKVDQQLPKEREAYLRWRAASDAHDVELATLDAAKEEVDRLILQGYRLFGSEDFGYALGHIRKT